MRPPLTGTLILFGRFVLVKRGLFFRALSRKPEFQEAGQQSGWQEERGRRRQHSSFLEDTALATCLQRELANVIFVQVSHEVSYTLRFYY